MNILSIKLQNISTVINNKNKLLNNVRLQYILYTEHCARVQQGKCE